VAFDPYGPYAATTRRFFILIDRLTNETAGRWNDRLRSAGRASNIHWQALTIDREQTRPR